MGFLVHALQHWIRPCGMVKTTKSVFRNFNLKKVLLAFYYPENPLIGEKIWEGSRGAVYTRSSSPYDRGLPYTEDFGRKGAGIGIPNLKRNAISIRGAL